jgi:hypothetical protein
MNAVAPLKPQHIDAEIVSSLVTTGDLSRLTAMQKVQLYNYRCAQVGLDPAAKPFDLLKLNGKEILYANAGCTQQLAQLHKLSVEVVSRDKLDDLFIVHARVKDAEGRSTDNTGAVAIGNLKGEALANAIMKATTKAIRRTVLAHVGLGMMDETEVETIPGAVKAGPVNDPRGDLSGVDMTLRDEHVSAIADILAQDKDEYGISEDLRTYVAEFLQQFQELYISVADELAARGIASKSQFRQWLKVGTDRK